MYVEVVTSHVAKSTTRRRLFASIGVLCAGVFAACGGDDEIQVFSDAQIGTEIEVVTGEQFEIRLESNPSTGYGWELSAMTTPDLVELESSTHLASDTDLVGAAGTDVFVLTAGRGAGILRLEYIRSFDDPAIPERVAEFVVRIDGAVWPPSAGTTPSTNTAVASG